MKKARCDRPCPGRHLFLPALVIVAASVLTVPASATDAIPDTDPRARGRDAHEDPVPEEIWDGFVEYLESKGKGDLAGLFVSGASSGERDEPDPQGDATDVLSEEEAPDLYPDFSRGDPIRGVLFRMSPELVRLDALFHEDEKSKLDPAERDDRIRSLVERLRKDEDPYLEDYALYYEARHLLEKTPAGPGKGGKDGHARKAARVLEKLVASPRFLGRQEVRRHLAGVYRRLGEDTLAILEIQFYLAELSQEDVEGRAWADEQLGKIRENHEGPLHDCVDRSHSITTRLSLEEVGPETQAEQEEVEEILTKVARLLEEMAGRCPLCNQKTASACKSCKKQGKMCKACRSAKPCQACGAGSGQKLAKSGPPRGNRPNDNPAQDTRLRRGDPGEEKLRDPETLGKEVWGIINDRDVARSLRDAWSRIPPGYRDLVARYFRDITDIEPESKKDR